MNPETHVLLLDVDGVLVTPPEWFGARLLREHPELTRQFFQTAFYAASTGKSDLRTHLPGFIAALGRTQTADEFLHEWLESENHPNTPLLDDVRQLRAAGWRSYLATNQEAHRTRHLLHEVGLNEVVDGEFASCTVGYRKPDPQYFAEVTRRLGWRRNRSCSGTTTPTTWPRPGPPAGRLTCISAGATLGASWRARTHERPGASAACPADPGASWFA
ncbi:HAD family hydrolase [Deinococcus malanensis]|uniref:HAD family hydrolase n=1 Tax=Deinococcus malanensis TaxID=1706855 RepID=UPI0036301BF1